MKKLILTITFYFLFVFNSFAGINANYDSNLVPPVDLISYNTCIESIDQNHMIDNYSIDIFKDEFECTVTLTGSIGISSSSFEVSISITADTCAEARAGVIAEFKALKDMLKEMILE